VTGLQVDLRAYRDAGVVRHAVSPRSLWTKVVGIWRQHRDLLANTVSLLGTTVITSALGFSFWTVAAREFSQVSVGYGSAAVSAMSLLSTIGIFGLGTVLIGELPRRSNRAGLVLASLLTSGVASLILGVGFAIVASLASKRFEVILGKPVETLTFGVGVALGAVALVFDSATIGLLRGGVQLTRNLVFAAAKMVALPITALVIHDQFGAGIFLSWIVGIAISLAGSAIWLHMHGSPILPAPDWGVLRGLGKTALAHNWLNLAIAVPATLIPVLVTVVVSPAANAAFYIAWMLTSFLMAVPVALSTVLFAVAAANPRVIAQKLRFALKLSLLIGVPAMVALFFGAHFALSLFGRAYASEATVPLMWLSLAYVPALPKNYYIAVCRAEGNISRAAVVLTAFAVAEIIAAGIGGRIDGLDGLSVAIFAVTLIEGMATTPAVLRAIRRDNRPQRTRKMTQGSASIETPANAWGRPDYNGRMRTQGRSTTSAGTLSIYNDSLDYPQQINSRSRDQQAEGIAVLERLARYQRQADPE
jgi:O-antigen/teichoic acid export membrane protein